MRRFVHLLPSVISLVLLAVSIWVLTQELSEYKPSQIGQSLATLSPQAVGWAILLTLCNCLTFTLYDTLATVYIRHPLPWYKTALVGLTSIPVSNIVGFGLLSGSAIRYRFYVPWGLSAVQIAQVIGFCNVGFWLGLFMVGGIVFVAEPVAIPQILHLPFASVRPMGVIFLAVIVAYLGWNWVSSRSLTVGPWTIPHLSLSLCLGQIATASLDWLLAATTLYALLSSQISSHTPLAYGSFFSIYLLAQFAGVVSNVPGGLGVFETVILLLLSHPSSSVTVLGALLTYRAIYYLMPLAIAMVLLTGYEFYQHYQRRSV